MAEGRAALRSRQEVPARKAVDSQAGFLREVDLPQGPRRWLVWCSGPRCHPPGMDAAQMSSRAPVRPREL